tara:strand:+ start:1510 stop:1989 length:480 start_codon:yes stop_codon:yes gene_type:complete
MPINRKLQHLDSYVGTANLKDDSVTDAKLGALVEKTAVFLYDFAVSGGAVSAITLTASDGTALSLPDNAIVSKVALDVVTALASSGSATVGLGVVTDGATNFKAATAFNDGTLTAAAQVPFLPRVGKKLTASRAVIATVGTAALTGGKFFLYVSYYEGN